MAREGFEVGRDQVARLMRVGGVSGATRGGTRRGRRSAIRPRHGTPTWSTATGRPSPPGPAVSRRLQLRLDVGGGSCASRSSPTSTPRKRGTPTGGSWAGGCRRGRRLVSAALRQALFTRRWTESRFTTARLVPHRAAGSQAGLQWSLQHLEVEVLAWEDRLGGRRGLPAGRRCGHRGVRGRGREVQTAFWDAVAGGATTEKAAVDPPPYPCLIPKSPMRAAALWRSWKVIALEERWPSVKRAQTPWINPTSVRALGRMRSSSSRSGVETATPSLSGLQTVWTEDLLIETPFLRSLDTSECHQ